MNKILNIINEAIRTAIDDYTYKETLYPKQNADDKEKLKSVADYLWSFFDNGYKRAGLDGFSRSCLNIKSLLRNAACVKLIYNINDELLAASVYTSRYGGYKCVGITSTTDESLRREGVKQVSNIVKEDILKFDEYYWIICSGTIEKMYEAAGGIKIPVEYLPAYISMQKYDLIPGEEYSFNIFLNDGEAYRKSIFGFNSKETMEEIIKTRDKRVIDKINYIKHLNENIEINKFGRKHKYSEVEKAAGIIDIFYEERCNGLDDLSPELKMILDENIKIVQQYVDSDQCSMKDREKYLDVLGDAKDIIDSSTVLIIHKG